MSFPGLKNHGLEVLPSPSPLFTAEVDYTTHTPLDSRHFKLLHDHILAWIPRAWMSIFGLDTEGMNEYIWLGYWGHEWVYLAWILRACMSIFGLHNLGYYNSTTSFLSPLQGWGYISTGCSASNTGYEHPSSLITTQTLTSDLKSSGHTHLQVFIALEPPLGVLPPIKDQVRNKSVFLACIALDTKYIAV